MQFTQPVFFLFVLLFFLGWRFFGVRSSLRLTYLVAASLVFYSYADWRQILLLLAVGFISFGGGISVSSQPRFRLPVVIIAICACLGLLFYFRYSDFFSTTLASLLALVDIELSVKPLISGIDRVPALGISFYTLQAVGYLLDVFRGRIQPTRSLLHYLAFLALFPKLLAGPIERGKDLLPQLTADHIAPTEKQRWEGTRLIVTGYFVKVVIADNLAPFVNTAFNAVAVRQNSLYWWVVVTAFAFQLYCDFGGYSAIAVGLGKWMGYNLTTNFKHPYLATSLAEFWTRWHISLSNWLRDYIFFPLNRSRAGRGHPYINLWITMLISGLWHGAAWQFILWGGLYGLYTSIERLTQWPIKLKQSRWGQWAAWFLVILQVWVAWVFFRSASIAQGWQIIRTMFSFKGELAANFNPSYLFFLALGICRELYNLLHHRLQFNIPSSLRAGLEVVFIAILLVASILLRGPGSQFVYFQF